LKQTVTQEDHLALAKAWLASDVSAILPAIRAPALILHPRDYFSLPVEAAMDLAAGLSNSQLVMTDGATAPGDALQSAEAIESFLLAIETPVAEPTGELAPDCSSLSSREAEVLRLLAAGRSNQQIADTLVISLNTVRRHVSNIFDKTGTANRAQAAVYARDHGLA
jgi:DNA-binding NarL/FixJ family response regulator